MRLGGISPDRVNTKKMKLGDDFIYIVVTPPDIAQGECGNRRQCPIACALNRQFNLGGHGYIVVDANDIGVTEYDDRFHYKPTYAIMDYLRRFDFIGEREGLQKARELTQPRAFKCKLTSVHKITPPTSRERKDQINKARNERNAELKARGIYRKPQKRYVGV